MEPVTHVLTGICLARSGLNRRAAYTTAAMAIAAEFPDIDVLWGFRGPVSSFQHHRGITHTCAGIPLEAALIVASAYAFHSWRSRRDSLRRASQPSLDLSKGPSSPLNPLTKAPVRWGLLYLFTLAALLSHLLLDFTNNYGLRPFFPFDPHWYAASITFIFDPLMFIFLLAAIVLPLIFRLVSSEIGARRELFVSRGWSVTALLCVVALWSLRTVEHQRALSIAMAQSLTAPASRTPNSSQDPTAPLEEPPIPAPLVNAQAGLASDLGLAPTPVAPVYLQAQRVLASPDPLSPFRWWTVTDFGPVYQLAKVDTRTNSIQPAQQPQAKLLPSPVLEAAERSPLGRAYLDWSPMPFLTVTHPAPGMAADENIAPGHTVVTFRDPRFLGEIIGMRSRAPLQGSVELDAANHVLRQTLNGTEQH